MSGQGEQVPLGEVFLRLPDVKKKTGMSRATLYRRIRDGEFPAPQKNGSISFWPLSAVNRWQVLQLIG